jgi:adenosylhomocysteine nucleosidase
MRARFVPQWITILLGTLLLLVPIAGAQCLTECSPRFGIVSAFGAEADILLAKTTGAHKYVINGNEFTTGTLNRNRVVIVLTGVGLENASMITQIMLDHFRIKHLLLSGIAGAIDPSDHVGDVVIPENWAFPLESYWNANSAAPSPCATPGDISCIGMQLSTFTQSSNSDYQIPTAQGLVGTGLFMRDTFVRTRDNYPKGEYKFDYAVDPAMFRVAQSIHPLLQRCGPQKPDLCVAVQPVVRPGGRGLSGEAFLANANFRTYVFKVLHGESIDMETTALAHVAFANGVPFIAFRSLSDLAGVTNAKDLAALFGSGLAEANASAVTLAFLDAWAERWCIGGSAAAPGSECAQP